MKVILVVDVDDELVNKMHSCDFVVTDRYGSNTIYPTISFKPMPHKDFEFEAEAYPTEEEYNAYIDGYKDCLEEIMGEQNESNTNS